MTAHIYCCPNPNCHHVILMAEDNALHCPNGCVYSRTGELGIPVFVTDYGDKNEYMLTNAAEVHDNALKWLFRTFRTTEDALRRSLVGRLNLQAGQKVLVTSVGAGNDIPYIASALAHEGEIHAQDIAIPMLESAAKRFISLQTDKLRLHFSASDATKLPYAENEFDAAYHFGGINLFTDISKGLAEMSRVVKPGGAVVAGDEGVAPWLKNTEYGKMLVENNRLYAYDAPMAHLPPTARDVQLTWELSNTFYVIRFTSCDAMPEVDIDIPHIGRRGGSIRSRYLGRLEGISPELKEMCYSKAEKQGISRVEFLEKALRAALHEKG